MICKRISDDTPRSSGEGYEVKDAVESYVDTVLSYQVQGLCPNWSYQCSVMAISSSGDSTDSTSAVFMTAIATPSQAPPLHLLAHSAVTIQVGWQSPSENSSLISGYKVEVRRRVQAHPEANHRHVVETAREICMGLSLSCQVLGLSPDSTYEFSVHAILSLGVSAPRTSAVFMTSKAPPSAPMAPYLLERNGANVRVGWKFPIACQGSNVESFVFQYSRLDAKYLEINGQMPAGCAWETAMDNWTNADESLFEDKVEPLKDATWSTAVELVGPTISHVISNLPPGAIVCCRVTAISRQGQGPFSPFAILLILPGATVGLLLVRKRAWYLHQKDTESKSTCFPKCRYRLVSILAQFT